MTFIDFTNLYAHGDEGGQKVEQPRAVLEYGLVVDDEQNWNADCQKDWMSYQIRKLVRYFQRIAFILK